MNILVTSAGIRGYIIRYFKESIGNEGKIFAADSSRYAPALYNADACFIIPQANKENYIDELLKLCIKNKIDGIVSLNDMELPVLAKNKKIFSDNNIKLIISSQDVVEICCDKYKIYGFLIKNGFQTPKTYISLEKTLKDIQKNILCFPLLIKPREGSASIGIKKIENEENLRISFENNDNLMIQEMLKGQEFGVDVFNDSSHQPVSIYVKKKIKMRAGETDKAISIYDKEIIEIIKKFSAKLELYGPADIDLIKQNNKYYITDVNPRFGGGYPLSHALGAEFPKKIISLIKSEEIKADYHKYNEDTVMMKQYDCVIINTKDLK